MKTSDMISLELGSEFLRVSFGYTILCPSKV